MKILFVTSELVPFVKTGGLADVSAALPKALALMDHDIRIIIPKYSQINQRKYKIHPLISEFPIPQFTQRATIEHASYPSSEILVYFVKCDEYYDRADIYGNYKDNADRAIFFSKAVLEFLKYINWSPEVIHCNDWQTALIPILLKNLYSLDHRYRPIRTLLTIHNLAYQGIFPAEKFTKTGLDKRFFNEQGLEFWGKLNLLKAGIIFADIINTVSPTYASEIQTKEYGYGLEEFLVQRRDTLFGIINGIDYKLWDPRTDPYIWHQYDKTTLEKKEMNKKLLQNECKLPEKDVPLIGVISRLVDQKGFDLFEEIIDTFFALNLQFVLLGTGMERYHDVFTEVSEKYPNKAAIFLKFDDILAHKIEAGADFFLMPSKYEPCGLNQLISLRYGTIPIVRKTGGLADSITDINTTNATQGTGFVFHDYNSTELLEIIKKAIAFYRTPKNRVTIIQRAMECDFSWQSSAKKYVQLYQRLFQKL